MGFALSPEGVGVSVETAEGTHEIALLHIEMPPPLAQRCGVGRLLRPKATVAASAVSRADGAAAGVGDRAQARDATRDHHADGAAELALHAYAVARSVRATAVEEGADNLQELRLVDRAA